MTDAGDLPLLISEVFGPTVQGEGPATGRLAYFIRLGACNLACSWCDAAYTWDAHRFDLRAELTRRDYRDVLDDLVTDNGGLPSLVVISGGEPLLQQRSTYGLIPLARALAAAGTSVHIETNGTLEPNRALTRAVDLFVVSPKLEHAGMPLSRTIKAGPLEAFAKLARRGKVIFKFVCQTGEDVALASGIADSVDMPRHLVWVMPEGVTASDVVAGHERLVATVLAYGMNMSTRLHILAFGDRRGT